MKLTIIVDDELAQENINKLRFNGIDITDLVTEFFKNIRYEFKYDFEPVTIQETVTKCNGLKQPRKSRKLTTK